MAASIVQVLRLAMMLTVYCLSMHRAFEVPNRQDLYNEHIVESPNLAKYSTRDGAHYSWLPTHTGRDLRQLHPEAPSKKRKGQNVMENHDLAILCRAAQLDWPPCNLFNVPWSPQQTKLDEEKYEQSAEHRLENDFKDYLDDQPQGREPRTRDDLIDEEHELGIPTLRRKRDTYVMEEMEDGHLPWDLENEPKPEQLLLDDQYEKRMSRFNSWGGKRSDNDMIDHSVEKRSVPFSSWGGKRSSFSNWGDTKDVMFSSWGGKRGPMFSSWGGKRGPMFSSWGGKRGPTFSSWGGKRGPAFSSWGGKRGPTFSSWGGKRGAALSSWGGKRGASFSSWGGKRGPTFSSWGGKRDPALCNLAEKRAQYFSSWGGKRDNLILKEESKRALKFSSWGGKRAPTSLLFDERERKVNGSSKEVVNGRKETPSENMITERYVGSQSTDSSPKHSYEEVQEVEDGGGEKRPAFSSWGGTHKSGALDPLGAPEEVPEAFTVRKRDVQFNPWGGKRGQELVAEGRTLFSSWGGKRGRTRSKQASSPALRQNRRGADFYPWGGKRAQPPFLENILEE